MAESKQKVITPAGVVCFANVWEPRSFQGRDPNYGMVLVFPKGTDLTELKRAVGAAATAKFGDKAKVMAQKGQLRLPFRDGEEYAEYGEPFVKGAVFINLKSRNAPGVVDARAKPIMDQSEFYSGCKARASVYAHAYDTSGNKGVTLLLNNVQKVADGERIDGRVSAEAEFGAVAGTASGGNDEDEPF